ncbi:TonB-dependent hemoglobin/transferrin/lactoferrin family receptor [Shinella pollutisoli]|uniref:TonB-dependent hemoglobin/transferrin/lactoferrin family receptor n=1 Tax=Shinella pollutisoli TaxID=2250594 RepID=A0ABV7DFV6_9HYPH|nr:TonB-dependent hemoglobin/transferrin/lactoferrin family receptor [Shinella pollutisoli]
MRQTRRNTFANLLLAGALSCLAAMPAGAQEAGDDTAEVAVTGEDGETTFLNPVVVTATRTETGVYDTLAGSSAITADQFETRFLNARLPEVLTAMPGISTQTSADDPGVAVNMRGLQDFGRVNVMVDGARQNFQKNGHEANGTFYLDTQMLKSVDVTRGPVSSVYGSGAIGGVVSFTTIDADDLIQPDAQVGGRVKTGYDSNGSGPTVHGAIATRLGENSDVLIGGTVQEIDDYRSGGGQTVNSAQSMKSGLAKWRFKPDEDHEFTLSGSRYFNSFENGATTPRETDVTADTVTAGYRYTPDSDLWDLTFKTYYTSTLFEQQQPGGGALEQSFDVQTVGLDLFNTSRFDAGAFEHELTYGVDVFRDRVNTVDLIGSSDDLTPSGRRLAYGAFIQDRIRYDSWLEVIGALRYDGYNLKGDAIAVDGNRLSPKVTVGVTPWEPATFYATYAEGYRAPALTETLIDGFHPPPVTGRFFPNPDLRPEVAHTVEFGTNLRFQDVFADGDNLSLKLGVFQNDVDDYIDQVFVLFPIPGGYQYQNIAEARIRGIEIEGSYDTGDVFAGLTAQILKGENLTTGGGLQKVPPFRIVATAGLRAFEERLTLGTRLTVVGEKKDDTATGFIGEPYQLVDVFAQYRLTESLTANLALNNIFDRDYTQYLNADPSPGFNARASLTLNF